MSAEAPQQHEQCSEWALFGALGGPAVVTVALLLWALERHPIGYYDVLRWVTCASCAWLVFQSYRFKRLGVTWGFAVVGIVFNPLVSFRFSRETWQVLNVGAAGAIAVLVMVLCWPHVRSKVIRTVLVSLVVVTAGYIIWRLRFPFPTSSSMRPRRRR
jgi:hypothetical protein